MSKWVKPARTAIQVVIGLIPVVPLLVPALGLSVTTGLGATLVMVASLASRVMQVPAVENLLRTLRLSTTSQHPTSPQDQ